MFIYLPMPDSQRSTRDSEIYQGTKIGIRSSKIHILIGGRVDQTTASTNMQLKA